MGEKGRELYGLGESPSNSLVIVFEAVDVGGAAAMDRTMDMVGAWVQWCWMRACTNPHSCLVLV